jgi:UDP-3-O-[3-hydroxymyristoyl] N-acetylglucosamine deacetylase
VEELEIVSTARATTVEAASGALRLQTIEHAMAALGGMGLYEGVAIEVEGPEMPLLDGGAAEWCEATVRLGIAPTRPPLRVAMAAVIEAGASRYEFAPGDGVEVEVHLELDDARIALHARWAGDPGDFRSRIAPARTFALTRDVDELLGRGLARHVDPAAVVLISPDAIHCAGRPFVADEPARHKLLDLVGDLYLRGGPPMGRTRAFRPGHAANARALRQACERGVLVRSS